MRTMAMMRTIVSRLAVMLVAVGMCASTGCSTTSSNTAKGAGVGGLLGAGIGAGIGAATGDAGTGAAIGGLLGAGTGGLIGADADARDKERSDQVRLAEAEATIASQPVRGPLSIEDVVQMSQPGANGARMSDDLLIDYVRSTNSSFHLSPGDIQYLNTKGVSDRVIREMINSKNAPSRGVAIRSSQPRTVVVQEAPPVVVYERPMWGPPVIVTPRPYCRPPPPVGFGFTYVKVR